MIYYYGLLIPQGKVFSDGTSDLYETAKRNNGEVLNQEYIGEGVLFSVRISKSELGTFIQELEHGGEFKVIPR